MTNPETILVNKGSGRLKVDPWKVRCWREVRGMRQQDVAVAMGYSEEHGWKEVSRVERYGGHCGPVFLDRLASSLRVKVEDLQSTTDELEQNRRKYDSWVADGRPSLHDWLRRNG